jgi:hypothetical protein
MRRWLAPVALLAISCARADPGESTPDAAGIANFVDDSADLAVTDMKRPVDLSPPPDLSSPPDLAELTCPGETYDVNAIASDGCEVTDAPLGNHSQATAHYVGSFPCDDGSSAQDIIGLIPADARAHVPPVMGFDAASSSAPDWLMIQATGGLLCQDDVNLHLTITGSATPSCYHLSVNTSNGTYPCQTDVTGNCGISPGPGSYSDGTSIFVVVSKTCAGNDKASYTITGHL